MSNVEFERAVLRELDQIQGLIRDGLDEARRANCTLDEELSELRLKVAKLELARSEPEEPRRGSWMRDGGLVLTPSLLIPLLQWWMSTQQTPPALPPHALSTPPAVVQPVTPGP